MQFAKILDRFEIVSKKRNYYNSFPTLIKYDATIWLAYRSGIKDESKPHGTGGKVNLASASLDSPKQWQLHENIFDTESNSGFEMDAILSGPFRNGEIILISREFCNRQFNRSYISFCSKSQMQQLMEGQKITITRSLLSEHGAIVSACFSHIQQTKDDVLLMPAYATLPGEDVASSVLWQSGDNGRSWSLRAVVGKSVRGRQEFNEYSLVAVGESAWRAVIRDNMEPFVLWTTTSEDDAHTWLPPEHTELFGHAPILYPISQSHLLLAARDLNENLPSFSVHGSNNCGESWSLLKTLNSYTGGLYNGGYGDVIHLKENLFLAAYYISDADQSPWIEGVVFSVH